jgi:uncharacterized protein YjiK
MTGGVRAAIVALAAVLPTPASALQSTSAAAALGRYDLSAPPADRWELPKALQEISGLAFDSAGRLFAHDDEQAIVYQLDPATHRVVKRFSFGRPAVRGDFEAIAVVGRQVILATSDGVLYAGREGRDGESLPYVRQDTGVGRYCETEGVASEPDSGALLFVCKVPRTRVLSGHLAVLRWSLDRKALDPRPRILLGLGEITRELKGSTFHPSELARDSGSGHYLVLAGREHAIAEITSQGQVVAVARLRRADHRQAEGLAVGADGALLIADEGAGRRGTVTVYRRR